MKQVTLFGKPALLMTTEHEINVGMGMFAQQYYRTGIPPSLPLLFPLQGEFPTLTMEGVPFPIEVVYYDKNWRMLNSLVASPGMSDSPIPRGTYWMYEKAI